MLSLRATMASAPFSNAIGTLNQAIRVGAAASTILRCDRAGGKTWHAPRRLHGRSRSDSENLRLNRSSLVRPQRADTRALSAAPACPERTLKILARSERFELPTPRFEV